MKSDKISRREFLRKAILYPILTGFPIFLSNNCSKFSIKNTSHKKGRKIYWWIGGGVHLLDTLYQENADGVSIAFGGYNADIEKRGGYPLVQDYGDMDKDDKTNDVINTINNLKARYKEGWRQLSTDLEWGYFDIDETKQFINAVKKMKGLKVIQWNGHWTWKQPQRDLLEQTENIILAEMVYPLVQNINYTYDECYAWIKKELSHYKYMPEDTHAIGLATVWHGENMEIRDPKEPITWEKMEMQINAAIDYGNSLGHPRQALAFYYPTPAEYAKKIMKYIRDKDNSEKI